MTILISHVLKESHGNAGSFLFPCDLHQFPRAIKNKHCSVTSLAPNCHCKFIRYLTWATREGVDARSSYFVGVDDRPACGQKFLGSSATCLRVLPLPCAGLCVNANLGALGFMGRGIVCPVPDCA
jgi:hypothetical protein